MKHSTACIPIHGSKSVLEAAHEIADFSSDTIQVVSASEKELPVDAAPVRFAVLMKDRALSNSWGINVENTGDAYIYCRDNMKGQKVSLHRSGKQHISLDASIARLPQFAGATRFMNQWSEPEFEDHAVATFYLLFPNWGVRLGADQIRKTENTWRKNELLIIGHEKDMTVVAFYIVDNDRSMTYRGKGSCIALSRLPLRPGKILHVYAWREPDDGELLTKIQESAFPHAAQTFARTNVREGSYCMSVTGERGETHYMVTFPVIYSPPD